MSTHNIRFHEEIRKNISTFGLKKSILSRAMPDGSIGLHKGSILKMDIFVLHKNTSTG